MSLGNLVWEDLDNDGNVVTGEPGIDGVTIYLMDDGADDTKGNTDDNILDSIVTAAGGAYLFDTIYPGEYYVKLNSGIPTDLISSTGEGDSIATGTGTYETAPDVDVVEMDNDDNGTQMGTMVMSDLILMELYKEPVNDGDADSTTNYGVDFGLFHTLTLGNLVWEDTNNDGLNNNGEVGIDNIEVILFTVGPNGVKDGGAGDDVQIAIDTTDANGAYLFEDLYPNEYYVKLNDIPTGMISSTAKENNALNTEPGIDADVSELDNDDNGTQMGSMVMSELVQLSLGEEPITDTDTDSTTNLSVDFGLFVPLSIGNLVWEDLDNDGQAETGEPGIDSVEVILFSVGPDGEKDGGDDVQVAIDTTDATGHYLFDTLLTGTYYVKINSGIPAGMYSATGTGEDGTGTATYEPSTSTTSDTNNDDDGTQMGAMIMSDTIQLVKNTEPINDDDIDANTNLSVDFGLIRYLSIGNLVWTDSDNDGLFNNSETGLDNIKVQLYQAGTDNTKGTSDDVLLDSTLTAGGGLYEFDSLAPGEYYIKLADLNAGIISSTGEGINTITGAGTYEPANDPDTDADNNDDNGTQMGYADTTMVMSDLVLLSLSDEPINDGDSDSTSNLTVDFGLLQTLQIGNLVWEDLDNDGLAEAGEPGIDSVELILYAVGPDGEKDGGDDVEIKRDTTDANGNYLFDFLVEATYYIKINSGTPTDMVSATGTGADGSGTSTYEPSTSTTSDTNNDDDGTQMISGSVLMVMSDTINLSIDAEPTNDDDADNNTNLSVDFGLIRLLSVGNLVWEDADNDGLNNNSETGIDSIQVILYQIGADGMKATIDDVGIDTLLTDVNGNYVFDSLYPGDYYVKLNDGMAMGLISSTGEGTGILTGTGSAEPAPDPDATDTNNDDDGTQMGAMVMSDLISLNLSTEPINDGDTDSTSNLAVDFGLYQTLAVGNLVWEDIDNDGMAEAGEPDIDSVEVILYSLGPDGLKGGGDDVQIAIDTTDANGNYEFTSLSEGTYYVKINSGIPTGYVSATGTGTTGINASTFEPFTGTDNDVDNDDDGTQMGTMIMSDTFQLMKNMEPINDDDTNNNTNTSIDFGLIPSMSLGNLVWEDYDNDGIAEAGEPGIDGITVYLMDDGTDDTKGNADDTILDSIVTAAGGQYLFDTIYPGEYYVKLNSGIPIDLISSTGEGDSIATGTGTYEAAPDVDASEVDNDDNGTQMGTMVMSELILMELFNEPVNDGDVDSTTNYGVDFGLFHTLTLGNLVWEDTDNDGLNNNGEVGIESIEVVLYTVGPNGVKDGGAGDDVQIAIDTTDANGAYLFEDLYPNEYYIKLNDIPTGMISSTAKENSGLDTEPGLDPDLIETNNDDNGTQMGTMVMSELVQLSLGEEPITDSDTDSTTNLSVDFGLFVPLSIGNLVFEDLDNSGTADVGELGIEDVEVVLYSVGPDGEKDGGDDIEIAIDTTDANGNYLFDTLLAGTYYVKLNSGIPTGMYSSTGTGEDGSGTSTYEPSISTTTDTNNDDDGTQMGTMIMSDTIQLIKNTEPINDDDADANTNLSVDFGLIRYLSVGNLVWTDSDNDGLFNNSEIGLDGIKVQLYTAGADDTKGTSDDVLLDSTLTASGGLYLFDSLVPGEYYIKLAELNAGIISSTGEGITTITGAGTYEPATDPDADATNSDDNGTQMGYGDTTMVMSDLVLLSLSDEPINDGDTDSTSNLTVDFGLIQTMTIGNLVWEDLDNDGIAEAGEPGIGNVELILFSVGPDGKKDGGDDVEIKRDTTDATGAYLFEYVIQGTYYVKINSGTPSNMFSSTGTGADGTSANTSEPFTGTDSNIDNNDDGTQMILNDTLMVMSDTFQIEAYTEPIDDSDTDDNTNLSVDFGLIRTLSIGNLVWEDNDNDGLNNNGETGIDGIEVFLISDGGDGIKGTPIAIGDDVILDSMLTANGGLYLFDSLYPGDYYIKLNDGIPAGMHSSTGEGTGIFTGGGAFEPAADPDATDTNNDDDGTQMGSPTMRMVMSDLVSLNLSTEPINDSDIDSTSNLAVDFGLYQTISVGNLVWEDLNNDGTADAGEPGIDSVEVEIYNIGPDGIKGTGDDNLVQTDTTDSNGAYNFTFLGQGTYYVKLSDGIPTGYISANGAGTTGTNAPSFEPGATTNNDADNDDDGSQMGTMVMSDTFQLVKNMEPIDDMDLDSNTNFSVDFGLIPSMNLGNLVWEDLDNDGIAEAGEPGIDGITVYLMDDGADNTKGNADDNIIDSILTAAGGRYLFDTIYPGEYYVKLNSGIPTDLISSTGEGDSTATGTGAYETAPDVDVAEVDNDDNGTQMGTDDTAMVMSSLITMELYEEPVNDGDLDSTTNYGVDFGLFHTLTLGNLVWEDLDNNGLYDMGTESGMDSVEVVLYAVGPDGVKGGGDDVLIAKDTTDANGAYLFEDLYPNNYYLVLESGIPANMVSSSGEGDMLADGTGTYEIAPDPDTDIDGDDDGTGMQVDNNMLVMSDILTLSLGEESINDSDTDSTTNLSVDFGVYQTLSIGNLVWEDLNNDGIADASEPKMKDIVVTLYKDGGDGMKMTNDDITIGNDTTDVNGNYLFDNLYPGDYFVKINDLPFGYISSTGEGINNTSNMGTYEPAPDADINTDNLDDGIFMDSMIMSTMVSLHLYDEPTNDADTDNTTNTSVDFGLFQTLILGNQVWEDLNNNGLVDSGEPGIEGIEVILYRDYDGTKNNGDDVEIGRDTTDASGHYMFMNLDAGMYWVKLNSGIPAGYMSSTGEGTALITGTGAYEPAPDPDSPVLDGDDNGTEMYNGDTLMIMSNLISMMLYAEQTDSIINMDVDFGLYSSLEAGNLVWVDYNNNGMYDVGEPGVTGVEVIIYQSTDGVKGNADDVEIDRDTTDADGMYLFKQLEPGDYWVKLNSGIPTGFYSATGEGITNVTGTGTFEPSSMVDDNIDDNDDGTQMGLGDTIMIMSDIVSLDLYDEPDSTLIRDSSANYRIDFALIETIDLGNLVWEDLDNDGIKDTDEPGFPDIEVVLFQLGPDGQKGTTDDVIIAKDTTDANGAYLFEYLYPNEYYVKLNDIPEGFFSSTGEGITNADGTGTYEPAADPDTNINNDDDGTQMVVDDTMMIMSDPFTLTLYAEPTDDGDIDSTTNYAVDFGLFETLELGNLVWEDLNNNGTFDCGTESGMDSVEVVLYQPGPDGVKGGGDDIEIAKDTTDANGNYLFKDLLPNEYYLVLESGISDNMVSSSGEGDIVADGTGTNEPAADPDDNTDLDDDGTGMQVGNTMMIMSGIVTLSLYDEPIDDTDTDSTTNYSVDFGVYQTLSIGNLVWEDLNNDGIADASEPKMKDIVVTLFKDGGDGIKMSTDDIAFGNDTTDVNGNYLFDNLYPGDYYLIINDLPFGMISSTGEGINNTTSGGAYEPPFDSDINTDNFDDGIFMDSMIMSSMVSLHLYDEPIDDTDMDSSTNLSIDFGLFQTLVLGNLVWEDLNNNGLVDTLEPGMEGIEVILYRSVSDAIKGNGDDVEIRRDTTDADGNYLFLNLDAGMYWVKLNSGIPSGYMSSTGEGTGLITGSGTYEPAPDPDVFVDGDDNGTQMGSGDTLMIMSDLISMILYSEQIDSVINLDVDFGLYNTLEAGNLVWEDLNNNGMVDTGEPGIEGVEVILYQTMNGVKADGDDVEIGRDTTDTMGMYIFQTLEPGDYWVKLNSGIPTGFYSSTGEGINTVTGTGTFEPSSMVDDNIDDNDDGTQMGLGDTIMIMSDIVSLDLYDEPDNDGTSDSAANYRIDFGLYETIDLGNLVWEDYDNDGRKDADEPGFPNIEVVLSLPGPDGMACTNDDIIVAKDTTDTNGAYLFEYLYPNEYFITLNDIPDRFFSSSGEGFANADGTGSNEPAADADDDTDGDDDGTEAYLADGTRIVKSDLFNLSLYEEPTDDTDTDSTTNYAVDFGLYESLEIGNLVWEDLDNDGEVDTNESGIDSIEVVLFKTGPDGLKGTADDIEIGRDTTDSMGHYEFIDLYPGDYYVKLNSGIPAHFASSTGEGTVLADGAGNYEPAPDPDTDLNNDDNGNQMGNPDGSLMVMSDIVTLFLYDEPINDEDVDSTH